MIHQPEILENILSRVPAKSIGRFRCVSKQWRTLLSQPQFIKTHLNQTKQSPFQQQSLFLINCGNRTLFTTHSKNTHHMFDEMTAFATKLNFVNHQFDSKSINVGKVVSCDGLSLIEDWNCRELLLVNPITKELKVLPESPYAQALLIGCFSYTMFGVGYDSASDDYKVVTVYIHDDGDDSSDHMLDYNDMFVDVYSVRNGTWKNTISFRHNYTIECLATGVFVQINWVVRTTSDESSVIVAFHLGEEKFREVPLPTMFEGKKFEYNLFTLEGCLSMFASGHNQTHVMVMKEYGIQESWIKLSIFDPGAREAVFKPLCLLGEEIVVLEGAERIILKKLVVYNVIKGRNKVIVIQGIQDNICVQGTFIGSLVSPHCSVEGLKPPEKN